MNTQIDKKASQTACCPSTNEIEKCALDNPDLPIEFIKDLLISKNADKSLAEPFNFEAS